MTATSRPRGTVLALTLFAAAALAVAGCGSSGGGSGAGDGGPSATASTAGAASSTAGPAATRPSSSNDVTPYRTRLGELSFQTPWGAWCGIIPKSATPHTPAAGCWEVDGKQRMLTVSADRPAESRDVQQGFFVLTKGPELPVGHGVQLDGVACEQGADVLTCTAGEHGFVVHRGGEVDAH